MRRALRLAREAGRRGEVPVGALVLDAAGAPAGAANATIARHDPSAHAEILALRRAGRRAGNYRLTGSTLYVTLEPCPMCLGAMIHARIARLVFGARDPKTGALPLLEDPAFLARTNHRILVSGPILEEECGALLRQFFAQRRLRVTEP
jgi:tRNA(adenine34) deaminase